MLKYISGICAGVILCGVFFMIAGCGEGNAKMLFSKNEFIVGKDIALPEIKDFYYTIDASTNPPEFQRYRFTFKDGKYSFYHEKREGNSWPLREKDITVSGTKELTVEDWQQFYSYIKDGKVTKRTDDATSGGKGPWLYLYWTKDKNAYQVFNFASFEQSQNFEQLCIKLKNTL